MPTYDVLGHNVTLEMKISSEWFPLFCAKEVGRQDETEEIETTNINSGFNREFVPGAGSTTVNCTGLTTNNSGNGIVPVTYLMQDSVRYAIHSFRIVLTDGNTVPNQVVMLFSGFFTSTGFTGPRGGQFSNSTAVIRVSGIIEYEESVDPPTEATCEVEDTLYLDADEGETTIQSNDLIAPLNFNIAIILLSRSGVVYTETTGTPSGMQFKFNDSTGVITFDPGLPFNAGEVVTVVYTLIQNQ